uniref:Cytochrome c oxidase subunit 4 isoform 2, mitochondrial n=1 Tax=Lygus hesperus TaxID=30085 RepID=A0A146LDA9_LYGHE
MFNTSRNVVQVVAKRTATSASEMGKIHRVSKIGNREVVGFGMNGKPEYVDHVAFPFPAIKFRELTSEDKALEEKAKGDWKLLTTAEKKRLYRINYCQTFAEMQAPTGLWKSTVGFGLMAVSAGVWLYMLVEYIRSQDPKPETLSVERQKAQLRRILDLQMNPIDGISSKILRSCAFCRSTESVSGFGS